MSVVINGSTGITTNSGTLLSNSTIGVGNATPAASGAGITFPATQSASSDANTLDDYEEGTWTPVLDSQTAGTGRVTTVNEATYTKIGRLVTISADIEMGTLGSGGSGFAVIKGLPFSRDKWGGISFGYVANLNNSLVFISGYAGDTTTSIAITGMGSAAATVDERTFSTYIKAGTRFIFTGFYYSAT